jgi:hypothetical protein
VTSPKFLSLRQQFRVFDHCLCFFANGRASSTIVFVSSTMVCGTKTIFSEAGRSAQKFSAILFSPPEGGWLPLVSFDSLNVGYAAISDGSLAVFESKRALLLRLATGLPLETVSHAALLGSL